MVKRISFFTLISIQVSGVILILFYLRPVVAQPKISQRSQILVTVDPQATATPTPFQPIRPTSTRFMITTTVPTKIPFSPTLVQAADGHPDKRVNILLLGSDQRSDPGFRTDVILLVSINPAKNTVNIISFPRDLYVTIPGWTQQRINTAFAY